MGNDYTKNKYRAEDLSLGDLAKWFFTFGEDYPDVFTQEYLSNIWGWSHTINESISEPQGTDSLLVSNLRAGLLSKVRSKVGDCFACPLSKNRLSGRPVFDDSCYESYPFSDFVEKPIPVGGLSAKIMIVSEGPGQFEQRTSIPFTSYQVLAGSSCATRCNGYEKCYNKESTLPQSICSPRSLESYLNKTSENPTSDLKQVISLRATEKFDIYTAGNRLDQVLFKVGLWRESWNPRQSNRSDTYDQSLLPKPGTVYICNIVKCRAADEVETNGKKVDGLKDREPTPEEVSECKKWLDLQIRIVQPKVIVALGKPAIKELLGVSDIKILSERTSKTGLIHKSRYGIPLILEVHPAFIMRQENKDCIKEHMDLLTHSFTLAKEISESKGFPKVETNPLLISEASFIPTEPSE